MKENLSGINLQPLTQEELLEIGAGSEFSEAVFRGIGWLAGQATNAFNAIKNSYGQLHDAGTPYESGLGRAI